MNRRQMLRMLAGAVAGAALGPQVLDLVESLPEPELLAWQDQLTQLCHDLFVDRIVENAALGNHALVALGSPLSAAADKYQFKGSALVFHTDLRYTK